jgi:hypothetical protein
MSASWMGSVCAPGYGRLTGRPARIGQDQLLALLAKEPGRSSVARNGAYVKASSTFRWEAARESSAGEGLSTDDEESNTTCSTPAAAASFANACAWSCVA